MVELNGISVPFIPIGETKSSRKLPIELSQGLSEFQKVFADEIAKMKLTSSAQSKINDNGISLSDLDMIKLESAITRAESKKSETAMVMLNDNAYIVDVPSRSIINAIDKQELMNTVIKGIDSAVFA